MLKLKLFKKIIILFLILVGKNLVAQTSPDFKGQTTSTNSDLVNTFTGTFNYSIPVLEIPDLDGQGYTMTLNYNSGSKPMEDASWVGFGWNLTPGAINREVKGVPDDYYSQDIIFWNKAKKNITVSLAGTFQPEIWTSKFLSMSSNATISLNNYKGVQISSGLTINSLGLASLNFGLSPDGNYSAGYSANLSPFDILNAVNKINGDDKQRPEKGEIDFSLKDALRTSINSSNVGGFSYSSNNLHNFSSMKSPYTGTFLTGSVSLKGAIFQIGGDIGFNLRYITQENVNNDHGTKRKVYGYMYSGDAQQIKQNEKNTFGMDYELENDNGVTEKDLFLNIPFGTQDLYHVSGNDVNGTFRVHNKKNGVFIPENLYSSTKSGSVGTSFNVGGEWGAGATINYGSQSLKVSSNDIGSYKFEKTINGGDESVYFKFENDLATSNPLMDLPNPFNPVSNLSNIPLTRNQKRLERAGFISFITREQKSKSELELFPNLISNSKQTVYNFDYFSNYIYNSPSVYNALFEGQTFIANREKQIHEFNITNKEGSVYSYGLPVYTRNERNFSYSTENSIIDNQNNFVYGNLLPTNRKVVNGQERNVPYASTYLLTSIVRPNYIDHNLNGLDDNDYGSFVKFSYIQAAGSANKVDKYINQWMNPSGYLNYSKTSLFNNFPWGLSIQSKTENDRWYKSRQPYSGFNYSKNSISDLDDDMASFTSSEKEIHYLEKVETKTHIAYFVLSGGSNSNPSPTTTHTYTIPFSASTNKQQTFNINYDEHINDPNVISNNKQFRLDNIESIHNEYKAGENWSNASATQYLPIFQQFKQRYLLKIILCSKDLDNPGYVKSVIKTTNFKYSYEAWMGSPNAAIVSTSTVPVQLGKLTLKEVSIDEGETLVQDNRLKKYQFSYINPELNTMSQTPVFNNRNIDKWGNYIVGSDQEIDNNTYLTYTPKTYAAIGTYDPAAWQLKRIFTPEGSEIRVNYESNEYKYVQNKPAQFMYDLSSKSDPPDPTIGINGNTIRIDLSITPFTSSPLSYFQDYFVNKQNKLYFKIAKPLLIGGSGDLDDCKTEYFDGFVEVSAVNSFNNGILSLTITNNITDNICNQFVRANRMGKLNLFGNNGNFSQCFSTQDQLFSGKPLDLASNILGALSNIIPGSLNFSYCIGDPNKTRSYVRLPIPENLDISKKAGGVRVKSIKYIDKFMECIEGVPANTLNEYQGFEYLYEDVNGFSSGVATNEPSKNGEESPMYDLHQAQSPNTTAENLFYGENLNQHTGPLGKSLQDGPSVGYSRVVVKNLYTGLNDQGFKIYEYYTAKNTDEHYITDANNVKLKPINYTNLNKVVEEKQYSVGGYYSSNIYRKSLNQGYTFITNKMNGQVKSIKGYGGNYQTLNPTTSILEINPDYWYESYRQEYDYFKIGEPITVMETMYDAKQSFPGYEIDYYSESKKIEDINTVCDVVFDFDLLVLGIFPFPIPFISGSGGVTEQTLNSFVVNKVISTPAIVKSITTIQDGKQSNQKTVALSKFTGEPCITESFDGFRDLTLNQTSQLPLTNPPDENKHEFSYFDLNFTAPYMYSHFGSKYQTEKIRLSSDKNKVNITKTYNSTNGHSLIVNCLGDTESENICNIVGDLEKGDILRVFHSNDNLVGFFSVNGKINNQVIIEPIVGSLTSTSILNGVGFEVIKSGKVNNLSGKGLQLKLYTEGNPSRYGLPDYDNEIMNIMNLPNIRTRSLLTNNINININTLLAGMPFGLWNSWVRTIPQLNFQVLPDPFDPSPGISFLNSDFSCIPFSPQNQNKTSITLSKEYNKENEYYLEMCTDLGEINNSQGNSSPGLSDLAVDLNAWLKLAWETNFYNLETQNPNSDSIRFWDKTKHNVRFQKCWNVYNPINEKETSNLTDITNASPAKYMMLSPQIVWKPCGDPSYVDGGLNEAVDVFLRNNDILNKSYKINGLEYKGSELIEFNPADEHGDCEKMFITKFGTNGEPVDTKLGWVEIKFKKWNNEFFGFKRHLKRYAQDCFPTAEIDESSPDPDINPCRINDCSNYNFIANQEGHYKSNWYKAWIDLPTSEINSQSFSTLPHVTTLGTQADRNINANAQNLEIFNLIGSKTIGVPNSSSLGYFIVESDVLKYKQNETTLTGFVNDLPATETIIYSPSDNNDLVNDLNDMLDKAWQFDFNKEMPSDYNWAGCEIEYGDDFCPSANDREDKLKFEFIQKVVHSEDLNEKVNEIVGLNKILDKFYIIDGKYIKGEEIISPVTFGSSAGEAVTSIYVKENNKAYLGFFDFSFDINDNAFDGYMGFRRQIQRYSQYCDITQTNNKRYTRICDCSNYNWIAPQDYDFDDNWYKAWIDVPGRYSHNQIIGNGYYESVISNSTPYENAQKNNNQLLKLMKKNFTTSIGRFEIATVNNEKWLVYKPINDLVYNSSTQIEIFKLGSQNTRNICCKKYRIVQPNPLIGNIGSYPFTLNMTDFNLELSSNLGSNSKELDCNSNCFTFCPEINVYQMYKDVISANITEYSDNQTNFPENSIFNNQTVYPAVNETITNAYILGGKGKWKEYTNYVYNETIIEGSTDFVPPTNQRVYSQAGVMINSVGTTPLTGSTIISPFITNTNTLNNSNWVKLNTNNSFDVNGNIIEAVNAVEMKTAFKYEEKGKLLNLQVVNAGAQEIGFESFENRALTTPINNEFAHTGKQSLSLITTPVPSYVNILSGLNFSSLTGTKQYVFRAWIKFYNSNFYSIANQNFLNLRLLETTTAPSPQSLNFTNPLSLVAQTGDWFLVENTITLSATTTLNNFNLQISRNNLPTIAGLIYIDDAVFYPVESEPKAFVYDQDDFKLLSTLDNQNFAEIYKYDDEGNLTQKVKETIRGLKTLTQVSYNLPLNDLNPCGAPIPIMSPINDHIPSPAQSRSMKYNIQNNEVPKIEPLEQNVKGELLDFKINENGVKTKIFENNLDSLKLNTDSLLQINQIKDINLKNNFENVNSIKMEIPSNKIQDELESLKKTEVDSQDLIKNNYKNTKNFIKIDSLKSNVIIDTNIIKSRILKNTKKTKTVKIK